MRDSHDLVLSALSITTEKTRYLIKGKRVHKYFSYLGSEYSGVDLCLLSKIEKTNKLRWALEFCVDGMQNIKDTYAQTSLKRQV